MTADMVTVKLSKLQLDRLNERRVKALKPRKIESAPFMRSLLTYTVTVKRDAISSAFDPAEIERIMSR